MKSYKGTENEGRTALKKVKDRMDSYAGYSSLWSDEFISIDYLLKLLRENGIDA